MRYSLPPRIENPNKDELLATIPDNSLEAVPALPPMSKFRDCCPTFAEAAATCAAAVLVVAGTWIDGLLRRTVRTRGTEEDVCSCRFGDDCTEDVELSPNEELDKFNKSLTELLIDGWWKPNDDEDVEHGEAATGIMAGDCGRCR